MGGSRTIFRGCVRLLRWTFWTVLILLLVCVAVCAAVWRERMSVVSRVARSMLDEQGLEDVSFRLTHFTPWRVVIDDIGWQDPKDGELLAVDRVNVYFSLPDLRRMRVERVHVQGVRTTLLVGDGMPVSPLMEKIKPLLDRAKATEVAPGDSPRPMPSFGTVTVRDARVKLVDAGDGARLADVVLDAGSIIDSDGRYRVWGQVQSGEGDAPFALKLSGNVDPETGDAAVTPEVMVGDAGGCLALARRLMPGVPLPDVVVPDPACSVTVRGGFSVTAWTNVGPFEVSAELGRGSGFSVPAHDAWVRFQSLRMDASGTLDDVQGRMNVGVAGFRVGETVEVLQEKGRALSLRGTARFSQSATNQIATATLESDLPGRTVAKVLPRVLPLVPVFFSDGGTLRADVEAERALEGVWQGAVRYVAESLRSSAPMSGAFVRAESVRVEGDAAIVDSQLGAVRTDITLEKGSFFKDGMAINGGFEAHLTAQPPYAEATGTIKGQMSETRATRNMPLDIGVGGVPFEGTAAVSGLMSNPVWQVALKVPEFDVAWTQQTARVACAVGGAAEVRYSESRMAAQGNMWARDLTAESEGVYTAGIGCGVLAFELPETDWTNAQGVSVNVMLGASNAWAKATNGAAELEDAQYEVPLTWSMADGLSFLPDQRLSWRRLEAQGLKVVPDGFEWSVTDGALELRAGVRVEDCAAQVQALLRVPLSDPREARVTVTLPETEIEPSDAIAAFVRGKAKGADVTGLVSFEADAYFAGNRPSVTGWVRFNEGQVLFGKATVEGLTAEVAFTGGTFFRTIEQPFVSFKRAKAGELQFGAGRIEFQASSRRVNVERAAIDWCKGTLNTYAVNWDFKEQKTRFTVYADRIDMGEALMMMVPFKGEMEGVLYGRLPVGIDGGKVSFSPGYLYSLPGQGGKLRMDDPRQMQTLLDQSGIKGDIQTPLSRALSDLDFSTLKFDLEPRADGEGTLRIKLAGKSNDKDWPAPVDLNLNLHGPLEGLLNMGQSFMQ